MRALPDDIHTWLLGSSPAITGETARRVRVELTRHIARPEAHIWLCTLRWPSGSMPVCIKQFTQLRPRNLLALFQRTAHLQDAMAASTISYPRLLACNAPMAVMVMSVASGESLERRIVRSFTRGKRAFMACESMVRSAASAMAQMHKLPIPQEAPMPKTCSNREYVERLTRTALGNRFVTDTLRQSAFDPESILKSLPSGFQDRQENRLLHGDCQAKNVLVDDRGSATLIDIDYGIGHPLRDVAQFLTQLERLYRRWRIPRARRILHSCGTAFCEQFAREGFAYLMEDLPFFRLWTISFALLADQHSTRALRRLIRHDLQEGKPGLIFSPTHCNWAPGTRMTTSDVPP